MIEWIIILGIVTTMYIVIYKYEKKMDALHKLILENKEKIEVNNTKITKNRKHIDDNHARLEEHYNHIEKMWITIPKSSKLLKD